MCPLLASFRRQGASAMSYVARRKSSEDAWLRFVLALKSCRENFDLAANVPSL